GLAAAGARGHQRGEERQRHGPRLARPADEATRGRRDTGHAGTRLRGFYPHEGDQLDELPELASRRVPCPGCSSSLLVALLAPELEEQRHEARRRGGYAATKTRTLAVDTPPPDLSSRQAVRQEIANLFQQARTGQLPAPVVSACNGLLLTWLRLAELELGAEL